jgi:hypothetical protein
MIFKIILVIIIILFNTGCSIKYNYKNSSFKFEEFKYTTTKGINKKYSVIYKRN